MSNLLSKGVSALLGGAKGSQTAAGGTPAYAAMSVKGPVESYAVTRRAVGPADVQIDIDYCGICHTDLHFVNNDYQNSVYPLVPGHEIVGRIAAVGREVTGFRPGDVVGVGCLVNSCRTCDPCRNHMEQFCQNGYTLTYNSPTDDPGGMTYGGYSKQIVVDQDYVLRIPAGLDPAGAAPLLCAGITTYSPLRYWNVGAGQTVGVVGLGGLGHMGIKFAKAMGAHVVMITTSAHKAEDAVRLGADEVLMSTDAAAMEASAGRFDFLLDTIPIGHDVDPLVGLLKYQSILCLVGAVEPLGSVNAGPMVFARRMIAGSLIGGLQETQEMLDFCGTHNITSDVEVIAIEDVNSAYERMLKSDVKYRFVIDLSTL